MQKRWHSGGIKLVSSLVLALVLSGVLQGCKEGVVTDPRRAANAGNPHRLDLAPLPVGLELAFAEAIAVMATMPSSRMTTSNVALQAAPNASQPFAILLAEERGVAEHAPSIVPRTCGLVRHDVDERGVVVCEGDQCTRLEAGTTAIVCDRSAIYGFYAFSRQWRDNQRNIRENVLKNDWTVTLVVDDMYHFAPKFVEWVRDQAPEPDVLYRDAAMATFLLAHEIAHTLEGRASPAPHEPERVFQRTVLPATGLRTACRNFQQFARYNPQLFGSWVTTDAETDATAGPGGQASFAKTRKIWKSELAADAYAVEAVRRLLGRAAKRMDAQEALLCADEAFMTMSVMSWYRDLRRFAQVFCEPFAGHDFFLTHCLCGDDERASAEQLLEDTHPPMPLRMMEAGRALTAKERMDTWPKRFADMLNETGAMLFIINQAAMVIAYNRCEKKEWFTNYPELSAAKAVNSDRFLGEVNFSEGATEAMIECGKRASKKMQQ